MVRGGIPRPIRNCPETLSQQILVGIILVARTSDSMNGFRSRLLELAASAEALAITSGVNRGQYLRRVV